MSTINHIRVAALGRGNSREPGVTETCGVGLRDTARTVSRSKRDTSKMTPVELVEAGYGHEDIAVILKRRAKAPVPYPAAEMRAWVLSYKKGRKCRN